VDVGTTTVEGKQHAEQFWKSFMQCCVRVNSNDLKLTS